MALTTDHIADASLHATIAAVSVVQVVGMLWVVGAISAAERHFGGDAVTGAKARRA